MNHLDNMGPPSGIRPKTKVFVNPPEDADDAFPWCVSNMGLDVRSLRKLLITHDVYPVPSMKSVARVLRGDDDTPPSWWNTIRQEWHRRVKASLELVARFEATGGLGFAFPESELTNRRHAEALKMAIMHLPGDTPAKILRTKRTK